MATGSSSRVVELGVVMSKYRMEFSSASDIVAERRHQQMSGHPPTHDDGYEDGSLLMGALAYLCIPGDALWPWDREGFQPSGDPIDNLIVAGALIAAEADRLKRCRLAGRPVVGGFVVLGMDPAEIEGMIDGSREILTEMSALLNEER